LAMGRIRDPLPVKLFVGVLTSMTEMVPEAETRLSALFGAVDLRSEPFPFDSTHYYETEMGNHICRRFFSFAELIEPSRIAEAKIGTNALEQALAAEQARVRRPVNFDPGYLEQSKIVLASTKNYYHRILISGGIYAEVTLHFEAGRWRSFPWSFPDFRTGRYDRFFASLRDLYRSQLKAMGVRIRTRRSMAERGGFEPPTPVLPA
jgi:hypothetical protein